MNFQEQLDSIFVEAHEIPEPLPIWSSELHQQEYLSNGEMHPWTGAFHTVVSPICIKTPEWLRT